MGCGGSPCHRSEGPIPKWCLACWLNAGMGQVMAGWGSPLVGTDSGVGGDEVSRVTPSHYRRHLRANVGLERLFPLPPAPTNKALPLPPWRAAASPADWGARKTQG